MINVKVLSRGAPECYTIQRMVVAAQNGLQQQYPDQSIQIWEVDNSSEIGKYASALILPTLVINEKVVCSGHSPSKEAVVIWLREALNQRPTGWNMSGHHRQTTCGTFR